MRRILLFALLAVPLAAFPANSAQPNWYTKAVKNISASFEPAEAKPGETVTFSLTVELHDGYFTYPLVQKEKPAADFVNLLKFPVAGPVIFVGEASDPKKLPSKLESLGNLMFEMSYCPGGVTYTRKAVVSPKATAGDIKIAMESFKISICDQSNCFPPKAVPVEASLKVKDGPPMPVDPAYADEVAKALAGK